MTSTPFELNDAPAGPRYVILHHTGCGRNHWDLMFEHGPLLATWQLYQDPARLGSEPLEVLRIADHRLQYLDYEGPISGDRGRVRRVARGGVEVVLHGPDHWRVRMITGRRAIMLDLKHIAENRWIVEKAR